MNNTVFSSLSSKFFTALTVAAMLLATLPVSPAAAANIVVNIATDEDTGAGTNCSLREAIIAANTNAAYNDCTAGAGNDTITLTSGTTYALSLTWFGQGDLDITSNITIQSSGANVAIIDPTTPAFNERVFDVAANGNLTLDTIRITTASTTSDGAAINNAGTVTIQDNSEIISNASTAGIFGSNGGGVSSNGTLIIANTTFTSNSATNNGGALYINGGTTTIMSSAFNTHNSASIDDGAAIYLNAGTLNINGTTFTNNDTSNGSGGAIYMADGTLNLGLTAGNTFTNNDVTGNGGAIFKTGGTMVVGATGIVNTFTTNTADDTGGAIYADATGDFDITAATFTSNSAANEGGAIDNDGETTATITGSTFSTNSATGDRGGAISNHNGGVIIVASSTFNGNTATATGGGALYNSGTLTINNSTLNGNSVNGTLDGGAIYNTGVLTIQNSTFHGNQTPTAANSLGGAIYSAGGTLNISFVSFSDNRASTGNGSDIHAVDGGASALNVFRSFLVNPVNSAVNCFSSMDADNVTNSLIEGNSAGSACGAAASTAFADTLTLANNGGSTQTLAITTSMTGIYNAAAACTNSAGAAVSTDQRGTARPQGANCDLGAFELSNTAPTVSAAITDVNVLEDAANTVFSLYPNFADAESTDAQLTYTVTSNTNAGLFTSVNIADPTNFTLDYAPDANGTSNITVRATDTGGLFVEDTFTVTVTAVNDAPSFTMGANQSVNEDAGAQTVAGWGTAVSAGPADESAQILTFTVTNDNNTLFSVQPAIAADGSLTYTAAANANGSATVMVVSLQDNGGIANGGIDTFTPVTNTFTITVNPVNDAPVCNNVSINTNEDTTGTTLPDCSDIDGDTLTYNAVDSAANGTGSFVDPNLTYLPDANFNGSDSFAYTANDGTVDSVAATVNVTINPLNDAPVCGDVSIVTNEDATGTTLPDCTDVDGDALTYSVIDSAANGAGSFVDPDLTYIPDVNFNGSDSFTYTANDGILDSNAAAVNVTVNAVNDAPVCSTVSILTTEDTAGTALPSCTDIDGDTLTYNAIDTAANGTGSFVDPDLTYAPDADFNGSDSFSYTANDGTVDSNAATVNVTINTVNDAPVCNNVSINTNEDTTGTTLPDCVDVDGDTLTYNAVDSATNGTGSFIDPDLSYMPDANFNGSDSFTYTANDGTVNSAATTVNVTVNAVNDAPVCSDVSINTSEDTTGTTLPDCTDVDGDILTYVAVDSAANGTGSFVDPDLTYVPDVNFNGSDSFTYTANDGTVDSNTATVNVTVTGTNDAPTNILLSNSTLAENNAINAVIGTLSATDIDTGDTFTFALTCSTPGANDASFNINGANLRASAVFNYETQNSYAICVRVRDQGGAGPAFDKNFTITISDLDEDAPETAIDSNPSSPTSSASASFMFSGDDGSGSGVAGFACSLDGGAFTACTSPQTYTGLADGSHTFDVRAIDNAGNTDPSPASFTWTVDTTAPNTTIDSSPSNPTSSPSASFTFSGNDGSGTGVTGFECQLNGGGYAACNSGDTFGPLSDGSHTFEVRALDALGNTDATPASFTWLVDSAAPQTTIDATPTDPSNDATPVFDFSGDDGSGSGIDSFACQIDGGGFSTCTSGSSFGPLVDGSHTFEVRATDNAGNTDPTSASYIWTVDATTPDTTITAYPVDPSASDAAAFTFTGIDGSGVGVASFECQLDGGGFSACSSPQNYTGLSDGSHTFEVRAVDAVGNIDASPDSYTWVIDTTTPDTTIDTNPTDPDNDSTPSFTFSGIDGGSGVASFECQIDSGGFNSCNSGNLFGPLSDGAHTFDVRALDNTGNTDPSPASYSWTIDTAAPDTSITSAPSDPSTDNTPDFSFTGMDSDSGLASFECQIDGGGFSACTSGDTFGPLGDGSHTFEVQAVDNAGNTDATPASFTWTVDTTAPETMIDSNPADPDNDPTPVFDFSSNDGSAVFECRVDGGGFSACTSGSSFGPLADESHTFEVHAVDTLGNTDPSAASYTWVIDTGTPETNIDTNPTDPSMSADAAFDFSSPDSDIAGFECRLDGDAFSACTSPQNYTGLTAGSHTFEVRAVDNSNNVDPTPASYTWMVDLGYPIKSGSTPANNANISTRPKKLTVRFNEDVKSDGSTGAANNPANYLLVENGTNTTFETVDCAGGPLTDDTQITIDSVTYTNNGSGPFVATLNINGGVALPFGKYRLYICGTTSIEDLAGNELNNGLSDAIVNFTVSQTGGSNGSSSSNNGGSNNGQGSSVSSGFIIPVTGFPKNTSTTLPVQPAELAYAATDLWLEIPRLGVKMSIVGVPLKDGNWDVKWLNKDAGWLNGSAYPTWNGNSVITGHVWDALNQPGPFTDLKKLKYGDQIKIHISGQVYTYEVRESESVLPTDTASVFKHQEKPWLTLVTCEDYNESSQTYSSRRMVHAVLVSVAAEK